VRQRLLKILLVFRCVSLCAAPIISITTPPAGTTAIPLNNFDTFGLNTNAMVNLTSTFQNATTSTFVDLHFHTTDQGVPITGNGPDFFNIALPPPAGDPDRNAKFWFIAEPVPAGAPGIGPGVKFTITLTGFSSQALVNVTPSVPEPSPLTLTVLGALSLYCYRRYSRN
jgi:hypothetical protein